MAKTYKHVDIGSSGGGDGSSWATSGGSAAYTLAEFVALIDGGSGHSEFIYYVKPGTYSLTASLDCSDRDCTITTPCCLIGVKSTTTNTGANVVVSDWETMGSATRPLFACGSSYAFTTGDYWKVFNLQFTGSASNTCVLGTNNIVFNCKSTNSSTAVATRTAFNGGTSIYISCEGVGYDNTKGYAFVGARLIFCYAHDCNLGVDTTTNGAYLFNIFDTAAVGLSVSGDDNITGLGNTFYNCTIAVSATDSYSFVGINNIIDTATDGFLWTTQVDNSFFAYNHIGNSVTDMWDTVEESVAAHKDNWVTSGSPSFTDAAGGNFSLGTSSPCIDAGMAMALGVG